MPQNQSIESLYQRYLANELNAEELADFLQRLHDRSNEETVSRMMDGTWKEMYGEQELGIGNKELGGSEEYRARVIPLYNRKAFKWIAAASIVVIIGLLTLLIVGVPANNGTKPSIATTTDVPAPSNTRAVITLANGTKVYLDSAGNGTIAQENNVNVTKNADGEVVYAMSPAGGGGLNDSPNNGRPGVVNVSYNTLFNPRGSKVISLTLSDGTRVWLNSESSLRYPTAFTANTREVEISGEAYFEVKHNAKQPFKVHLPNGSIVEDIGTSFNVNAYSDEADIKTTLIEGSVKVVGGDANNKQKGGSGVILKPGEQGIITHNSQLTIDHPDLEAVLAWKDGRFQFEGAGIESVMREIARWYDVNVVYETKPKDHFRGAIPRNVEASKVFQMLETMGVVKFEIKGKTVIVKAP